MKNIPLAFMIVSLAALALPSEATIPAGFKSLYEFKDKKVVFNTLNDRPDIYILLSTNYDSVRLPSNNAQVTIDNMKSYLEESNIKPELITLIIKELEEGVSSDKSCRGKLSECIVSPETFSFVYDHDENYLRLFVNAKFFNSVDNSELAKIYAHPKNESSALVNSNNIYFSHYNDQDVNYTINNTTLLGLPIGHLVADLSYSNSALSEGVEIKELSYDTSLRDKRLYLGKFKNSIKFNATDFLSTNTRYQQISANFGSSKNLLVGERSTYDKLFYYAPTSGELVIYRDDRVIKQFNIREGQGSISYSDLPSGRYEVRVEVVVAGQVISSELVQIYNSSRDTLAVGDFDYLISAGVFDGSNYGQSSYANDFEDKFFTRGLVAARLLNPLVMGAGALHSDNEWVSMIGTQLYLPYQLTLDMKINYFNDGSHHFDGSIGNGFLSLRHEDFSLSSGNGNLAQFIYSDAEYSRTTLNGNYRFSNGIYLYTTLSKGKQMFSDRVLLSEANYSYWSASSGVSIPLPHGMNLGVSLDYQDNDNSLNTLLNLTVPLGDGYSSSSMLTFNDDSLSHFRNSLNKSDIIKIRDLNSDLSLSHNYYSREENKNTIDAVLTASTKQDYWQGNAYVYADSTGERRGVSGSLSSSQIFDGRSLLFTSDKSDAYALVEVENPQVEEESYGYVTFRRNGNLVNKSFVYDDKTLFSLNSYNEYDISIETESVSLINLGDKGKREYVKPGSVVKLKPNLRSILSFVSSFEDIMGEKVKELKCEGSGCHKVQKVTDGVFQVSLMDGLDFELYSGDNTCIIPINKFTHDVLNFGRNYCVPNIQPREYMLVKVGNKNKALHFIGLFDADFSVEKFSEHMEKNNLTSIIKDIGNYKAVYLLVDENVVDYASLGIDNELLDIANVKNIRDISIKDLGLSALRSNN